MAASTEAPKFTPQETFEKAFDIKREVEGVLLSTPGFLQALGRNFLAQVSSRYVNGEELGWTAEERRFRVDVSLVETLERRLGIYVYEGEVCDSVNIELNISRETGSFSYRRVHISGAPIDSARDNQKAIDKIRENVLNKLGQE